MDEIETYIKLKYPRDKNEITREYLESFPESVIIKLYNKVSLQRPRAAIPSTSPINHLVFLFSLLGQPRKSAKMQLDLYCKYIDELLIEYHTNERN